MDLRNQDRGGIALDANVFTFLVEAFAQGYQPDADPDRRLRIERVAALQAYLYAPDEFFLPPTVRVEASKISDRKRRLEHSSVAQVLISDLVGLDYSAVAERMRELLADHSGEADCRILAEAEAGGVAGLLTFDDDFTKHLAARSPVALKSPSTYLVQLEVPPGSTPRRRPHVLSPLASESWWRL